VQAIVVGAGPVGLFSAMALARRGHDVTVIDRDPGPDPRGGWNRKGVMQFMLPHAFRPQVHAALTAELPDVIDAVVASGAHTVELEWAPGMIAIQCRRATLERVFRTAAAGEPRLQIRTGHVDAFAGVAGRVTGVVVDGQHVDADLVVAATGRVGRIGNDHRAPAEGGSCGFSYVARMYRARPGVEVPISPIPFGALYDGYLTIAFPQDDDTVCALVVRPTSDDALAELRHEAIFQQATATIPNLAPWTDPERFVPITPAMAGSGLTNSYRSHLDESGRVPLAGLLFVGDAVSTTNPAAGRGVSLGLGQARHLLGLLDAEDDLVTVAERLDAWCTENIRPWYEDHVYWDATLLQRLAGDDINKDAKIPSDVIAAAVPHVPELGMAAARYLGMVALPSVLTPYEQQVRDLLGTGWRPPLAPGPTRDELAAVVQEAVRHLVPAQAGPAELMMRGCGPQPLTTTVEST
jgi:2-polyprenyl-6-methoxyphenol hydroxylase-like FAD-dependent oxidoreductase